MKRLALTVLISAAPAPVFAGMYFNSSEPGCDGSDPTIVACDDFEDGTWYEKHCDDANATGGLLQTDGWCGTIYADPITPANAAICGGKGAGGTSCAATSGYLDGSRGGRNMADHDFAGQARYNDIYFRYYIRTSPDTVWSGEKMVTFNVSAGSGGIIFGCAGSGNGGGATTAEFNIVNKANDSWLNQNLGRNLGVAPNNHWYYVELHMKLNTPGAADGVWEVWIDDCGLDGLGCTGPGTLRSRHTNAVFRTSDPNENIGAIWIENWGNNRSGGSDTHDGSIGTHDYDQIVIATRRIGPMAVGGPNANPSPARPKRLALRP